jgi:PAS domain S-box-containing protein
MSESLDIVPCGVLSFDDDGTVVAANATLATMLGYDRDELAGKRVEALLTVSGRIFYQTHLYPVIRLHGRAEEMFVLFRRKDGSDVGTLMNARRRGDAGSTIDCAIMEVRERRKYEDALLRAKQAADTATAESELHARRLEMANETLENQAVELELQQQQLQEQAAELEAQSEELQTINDELIDRGEELERARKAADDANHAKSQFLAVMSHELRTPLNAIGGYVQLMELGIHGPITDAQRDAFERIMRGQRHLLRLINDVLNLARIEAGHVEYSEAMIDVADVFAAVVPMIEPQVETAGLTFTTSVAPGLVIWADREKVDQIMINLLTNAIKFTPAGGSVSASAERDAGGTRVLLHVTDTGIGIAADKLASVFEPFVQVDVSHTRSKEGSGLGLAISRDLAHGMRGDLTARSEAGRGSTFTLALPSAPQGRTDL